MRPYCFPKRVYSRKSKPLHTGRIALVDAIGRVKLEVLQNRRVRHCISGIRNQTAEEFDQAIAAPAPIIFHHSLTLKFSIFFYQSRVRA
jgi:hypothetical protein